MSFKEKRKASILYVLAAMLGASLVAAVATGGTFAAGFSSPMKYAELQGVANPMPHPGCEVVLDASDKLYTTPFHMYMTQTSSGIGNGKPISTEMVFAGGARYVLFQGKWSLSPVSTEEMRELEQRNRKNAKNQSCHYVRDESVNGEGGALYSTHSESEHGKDDNQIWLSKSRGLILRQETDLDTGGASGKSHLSVRYEYGSVQVPQIRKD